MLILIGASASGKTEVAKLLAKKHNIEFSYPHTIVHIQENTKKEVLIELKKILRKKSILCQKNQLNYRNWNH